MDCREDLVQSWFDLQQSSPFGVLDIFANVQLQGSFGVEQGKVVDSFTFSTPPSPPTLLKVVGARIIDSTGPFTRANLINPISTLIAGFAQNPNRIEIDFNIAPKTTSVTGAASITVTGASTGPVAGITRSMASSTTARLALTAPLPSGDTYLINVNGTTTPSVVVGSTPLDGEALGLPSGDGVAGGDFIFGVQVIAGAGPIPSLPSPLPIQSNWFPTLMSVSSNPTCLALESDNLERVAAAAEWNFQHLSAYISPNLAPPLQKVIFLRAGPAWQMNVPIDLGYRSYAVLELSLLSNAGTRGDCQGSIPSVVFAANIYRGIVTLQITLKTIGQFVLGIRATDSNGYYSMFELDCVGVN
jgi:hypothetical protein